jgi:hypothetical protein
MRHEVDDSISSETFLAFTMIILSPLPIGENKSLTLSPLQPSGVERDP